MSTPYNICILPDVSVTGEAIEMSKKLGQTAHTEFVLNTANFFPHISVYHILLPEENLDMLHQKMTLIAAHIQSFKIELSTITIEYETFISWNCLKSGILQNLHDEVIQRTSSLRSHEERHSSVTNMTAEDKIDQEKYGMIRVGPRYYPHLTLSRLSEKNENEKVYQTVQKDKKSSFICSSLTLGALGKHGTVNEIIKMYPLRES